MTLTREIKGICFNVLSPSHYQAAASPDVHILYNGVHWCLIFSTATGNNVTIHDSLLLAARELNEAIPPWAWSAGLV
jgi:hypothetical protein